MPRLSREIQLARSGTAGRVSSRASRACFRVDVVVLVEVVEADDLVAPRQQRARCEKPMNPAAPVTRIFHSRRLLATAGNTCLMS